MVTITASAPGKILWLGAYSVLESKNVSYSTSIDKRVTATVKDSKELSFVLPDFGISVKAEFEENQIRIKEKMDERKTENVKFVKAASEACLTYLEERGKKVRNFSIATKSDKAFGVNKGKSGLGSSAAVTVASVAAILAFHGMNIDKSIELVHRLAQYAHYKAQGKLGSGFDVACSTYGTCVYTRFSGSVFERGNVIDIVEGEWDHTIERLTMPKAFNVILANFVRESASTVEMIKKVKEWKERNPSGYNVLIARIDEANKIAIESMRKIGDMPDVRILNSFKKAFNLSRNLTRELGVLSGAPIETEKYTNIIRFTLKNGAFVCKLTGAGGGDSIAAICLTNSELNLVKKLWSEYKELEILDVGIENSGVICK